MHWIDSPSPVRPISGWSTWTSKVYDDDDSVPDGELLYRMITTGDHEVHRRSRSKDLRAMLSKISVPIRLAKSYV